MANDKSRPKYEICKGFPSDRPDDPVGRPVIDDERIIKEAIHGLKTKKYKTKRNALDILTSHLEEHNKNTAMERLKKKLNKALNELSDNIS